MWDLNKSPCLAILKDVCPQWADVKISTNEEYLGFIVGIDAPVHCWDKPLRNFELRIDLIRKVKVGLAAVIFLYNVVALPTLSHVAQPFDLNSQVVSQVRRLLLRIIPAPGNWCPPRLLERIALVLPFHGEPLSVENWSLAARSRVIFATLKKWSNTLVNSPGNMPMALSRTLPHAVLRRNFNHVININVLMPDGNFKNELFNEATSRLDSSQSIQSRIYKLLINSEVDLSVFREFENKMKRWNFPELPQSSVFLGQYSFAAQRTALALFRAKCPQRSLNAVLITWLNAWISPNRFGYSCPKKCFSVRGITLIRLNILLCAKPKLGLLSSF